MEDSSTLQTAIETPIDRGARSVHVPKQCIPATELALLPDNRQWLELLKVWLVQIEAHRWSTILAEVNGLLLRAFHDGREMDRGFFLMAFRAKHDDCANRVMV